MNRLSYMALSGVACLALAGCAPAAAPSASPVAELHARRCGKCHAPPEPGSHSRAKLEDAFGRHGKRVNLSRQEWSAMVDYLAAPEIPSAPAKD